jgi:cytoskeletal protein RodZ
MGPSPTESSRQPLFNFHISGFLSHFYCVLENNFNLSAQGFAVYISKFIFIYSDSENREKKNENSKASESSSEESSSMEDSSSESESESGSDSEPAPRNVAPVRPCMCCADVHLELVAFSSYKYKYV